MSDEGVASVLAAVAAFALLDDGVDLDERGIDLDERAVWVRIEGRPFRVQLEEES
jgi:hypothetical protein